MQPKPNFYPLVLFLLFSQMACSSGAYYSKTSYKYAQQDGKYMTYNASVELLCKNPDNVRNQLPSIAEKYQGYVSQIDNESAIIKVKSDNLNNALDEISLLGKVIDKNIEANDITNQYLDVNIRLENYEKSRNRYLELLAKAQTVEEILQVEKELERLNGEIELLKSEIERFDQDIKYSTISVYYDKKAKPGILGYVFKGLYKGIRWLFVRD